MVKQIGGEVFQTKKNYGGEEIMKFKSKNSKTLVLNLKKLFDLLIPSNYESTINTFLY